MAPKREQDVIDTPGQLNALQPPTKKHHTQDSVQKQVSENSPTVKEDLPSPCHNCNYTRGATSSLRTYSPRYHDTEGKYGAGLFRVELLQNLQPGNLGTTSIRLFDSFPNREVANLASRLVLEALPAFHSMLCRDLELLVDGEVAGAEDFDYWYDPPCLHDDESEGEDERAANDKIDVEDDQLLKTASSAESSQHHFYHDGSIIELQFPEPLSTLTREQREKTLEKLSALADILQFVIQPIGVSLGRCKHNRDATSTQLPGVGSIIEINDEFLGAAEKSSDLVTHQYAVFKIAETLLHETSHAVQNAAGRLHYLHRIFLGPQAKTTEVGFEVQVFLFGGLIGMMAAKDEGPFYYVDGTPSQQKGLLVLDEWPMPELLSMDVYMHEGFRVDLAAVDMVRVWNVPIKTITDLHQKESWPANPTPGRLIVDRRTGIRESYNDGNDRGYKMYPEPANSPDATTGVPRGFSVHPKGLLYRTEDGVASVNGLVPEDRKHEKGNEEDTSGKCKA